MKSLENNCKVLLIDYEYSGWNTMAHELANYLNECVLDNAHPCGSGIAYYPENEPTAQEVTAMLTRYLQRYWEHVHGGVQPWDTALTDMLPGFELAVKKERILCLFFVMIWAFKILNEEDVADPSIYHFEYVGYQLRYLAWMRKTWGL